MATDPNIHRSQQMSLGPTLLQVLCGSCHKTINVHAVHIDDLMRKKTYTCPNCKNMQSIEVNPEQERLLRDQATQHFRALAFARIAAPMAPPAPASGRPPLPPEVVALLQQQRLREMQQGKLPRPVARAPNLPYAMVGAGAAGLSAAGGAGLPRPMAGGGPPPWPPPQALVPDAIDLLLEEEDGMEEGHTVHDTFMEYKPAKLGYGVPHPDAVVETASLAAVEPPDITYTLAAHTELVEEGRLSALQLEAVVYACQRHEQRLPSGARGGFFIGDGAGVGKGRTIAGLMLENWRKGRKRHLWVSVGSDLKVDAERDLNDVGAVGENGIPLHALNKLPYGKLDGRKIDVREGIVFLTYSALVSASAGRSRMTRFKQLKEWCGPDFDGLIVFDESHKAKNLVPEAGNKATQVGMKVQDLQNELPNARIVYCSATGASEPRNMGYMVRLGLWGEGHAGFPNFSRFLDAIQGKGGAAAGNMAALELVAMDMKAQGMYVCRTLSFAGAEFQSLEVPLEEPVAGQYHAAADMWNKLFREFMKAEELAQEVEENLGGKAGGDGGGASEATSAATSAATSGRQRKSGFGSAGSMTWRAFWAAHQRFFRHMCMAAKVPAVVRMAIEALEQDKCVVIGLQSTGEARTAEVVKKKRDEAMRRKMKEELELKDEAVKEEKSEGVKDEVGEENPEEVKDEKVEEVVEDVVEELDDFVSGPKELLTQLVDKYYPMPPYREGAGYGSDSDSDDDDATFQNKGITGAAANGSLGTRGVSKRARSQVRYKEYGSEEEIGLSGSEGESSDEEEDGSDQQSDSDSACSGSFDGVTDGEREGDSSSDDDSQSSGADGDAPKDPRQEPRPGKDSKLMREEEKPKAPPAALLAMLKMAWDEALFRKKELLEEISKMELPANPLDDLIDRLGGPNIVAEMTGRKGRLVRSAEGGTVRYEPRNASGVVAGSATLEVINIHERKLFMDGNKLVAIISEAASAGISLHADRRAPNQRRRVHLTLELPWSADKAIQQFGRSHRANQAHGPQYRLIFTPLGGEKRFAAAVARRLESLGALTQGDRRAGPSLAEFNYESTWGQRALREMYTVLLGEKAAPPAVVPAPCRLGPNGEAPQQPLAQFLGRARALLLNAGLLRHNRALVKSIEINKFILEPEGAPRDAGTLEDRERTDVPRFLNRLLGLEPSAQADIFDYYQDTLDDLMERARREGTLDEGIVDLTAHSVTLDGEPRVLHKDAMTGAACVLHTLKLDRGLPFEFVKTLLEERLAQEEEEAVAAAAGSPAKPLPAAQPEAKSDNDAKEEETQEMGSSEGAEKSGVDAGTENGSGVKRELEDTDLEDAKAEEPQRKRRKRASLREAEAGSEPEGEIVDLASSDSEDDGKKVKGKVKGKAAKASSGDVAPGKEENVEAGGDAPDAKEKEGKKPLTWGTGFYRTRQEGPGGRVHVMLALKIPKSDPTAFTIYRPGTGRTRKAMTQRELKKRYIPLTVKAVQELWEEAHKRAGDLGKDGRPSLRHRTVHLLCGAVMRSWGAVQRALVRYLKSNERRMRVVGIITTGEESQRVVGMFVPEAAVDDVVKELTGVEGEGAAVR